MNKEKQQIEEMAITICRKRHACILKDDENCRKCDQHERCLYQDIAYALKQDYAREIFAEIEKAIDLNLIIIKEMLNVKGDRANGKTILLAKYELFTETKKFLAELKKKYIAEGMCNTHPNELDILKSTITRKEDDAYNKGYEDAKADIWEKLQAEVERAETLAKYGDDFYEGKAEGVNAAMNCILSEGEE